MVNLDAQFVRDIERIQSLDIVPAILEIICRTTGMGFAAVARVTESKWIACAVKDEIQFGLKPGDELVIETTICNEIRGHGKPVIIDEVSNDTLFRDHHTPAMYGFQSYISIPIILKDGSFFGTLCAIDPRPFPLKASNMMSMFNLFADLISYHLLTLDLIKVNEELLSDTENRLQHSLDDIRQYAFVSRHTLREPLRKIQVYTDLMATDDSLPADHIVKKLSTKVNLLAKDCSTMFNQLTNLWDISGNTDHFNIVDLNEILKFVINRLQLKIIEKDARIDYELLHVVPGIPQQISQLFYCLLDNSLKFSRPGLTPVIRIYSANLEDHESAAYHLPAGTSYCKICFEDNGIGIEDVYLNKIFDLFAKLHSKDKFDGLGMGLSQSKKIMLNHRGDILVQSTLGAGSTFSLVFPLN